MGARDGSAGGKPLRIAAQPGPQSAYVGCDADIAIYGGAAYAGKTYGTLLCPVEFLDIPEFSYVVFRRETTQIRNPGGMWDESCALYRHWGVKSLSGPLEHTFPSGAKVKFAHLEHENDVYSWDGAQIPAIAFDQLEHFTRKQFFYLLSRNRDPSGKVWPFVRATCNPNADSWLAEFLAWWIDQETGFPVPSRAGVKRWMVREGDTVHWYDTRAAAAREHGEDSGPLSVTFIPGTIDDNAIGNAKDPSYRSKLKALNKVERERLLGGNWKIRPQAGLMFRREWCEVVEAAPADVEWVRYWDLAATEKTESNDPDWSVGLRMGRVRSGSHAGKYVLDDVRRMRRSAGKVRTAIVNTALGDGEDARVGVPQDPGQAGKDQASQIVLALDGFQASSRIESGDKVTRFSPFSAQAEAGNVLVTRRLLSGPDGDAYLTQLEQFPDASHKDDADATSGAYAMFQEGRGFGLFEFMRAQHEEAKASASRRVARAPAEASPQDAAKPEKAGTKKAGTKKAGGLKAAEPRKPFEIPAGALQAPEPQRRGPASDRFGGVPVADPGARRDAPDRFPGDVPGMSELDAFFDAQVTTGEQL